MTQPHYTYPTENTTRGLLATAYAGERRIALTREPRSYFITVYRYGVQEWRGPASTARVAWQRFRRISRTAANPLSRGRA